MKQPKVVFLDAVGTLFGVRTTVGNIYADLAKKYGIEVSPEVLQNEFTKAFSEASPLAFPGINSQEIPEREFNWWFDIAQKVFQQAGVLERFIDFKDFFEELYIYFASDEPWVVYPEVKTTLQNWQKQGVELGIISNFDSRLLFVLPALGLDRYFQSITISSQAGVAKPNGGIFLQALEKHNCQPQEAYHIGDSQIEDVEGATAAGLTGILIQRSS
jgi:putative hydrolase of the HAD superfamily